MDDFRDKEFGLKVLKFIGRKLNGKMDREEFIDGLGKLEEECLGINFMSRPDGVSCKSFKQVQQELIEYYSFADKRDEELRKQGIIRGLGLNWREKLEKMKQPKEEEVLF